MNSMYRIGLIIVGIILIALIYRILTFIVNRLKVKSFFKSEAVIMTVSYVVSIIIFFSLIYMYLTY